VAQDDDQVLSVFPQPAFHQPGLCKKAIEAMAMRYAAALVALLALVPSAAFAEPADDSVQADAADAPASLAQHKHHHHKHHHHKHHHHKHHDGDDKKVTAAAPAASAKKTAPSAVLKRVSHAKPTPATQKTTAKGQSLSKKMKSLETKLHAEEKKEQGEQVVRKSLKVNGPLPANFEQQFSQAVAKATHSDASKVKVVSELPGQAGIVEVFFTAPKKVADEAEDEAGDSDSPLATGQLQSFLTAKGDDDAPAAEPAKEESVSVASSDTGKSQSLDINAAMPYGDLEPFGREDTGQELTEDSISESNEMVDQLERAEVAEEKRAVFRALTRLRGAAITSFDGIARSQTGNIDEYNKVNKWRKTHPLHHLADEESDVSRWAFPDIADF
jgi:hypothetical protein